MPLEFARLFFILLVIVTALVVGTRALNSISSVMEDKANQLEQILNY